MGNGIISAAAPQLIPTDNHINVWSLCDDSPNLSFALVGHTDIIWSFGWRYLNDDINEMDPQLLSWGRDRTIRIFTFDQTKRKYLFEDEMDVTEIDDQSIDNFKGS